MQDWVTGQLGFMQVTTEISAPVVMLGLDSMGPQRRGWIPMGGSPWEADFNYGASFPYMIGTRVLVRRDQLGENEAGDIFQWDPASRVLLEILFSLTNFGDSPTL